MGRQLIAISKAANTISGMKPQVDTNLNQICMTNEDIMRYTTRAPTDNLAKVPQNYEKFLYIKSFLVTRSKLNDFSPEMNVREDHYKHLLCLCHQTAVEMSEQLAAADRHLLLRNHPVLASVDIITKKLLKYFIMSCSNELLQ